MYVGHVEAHFESAHRNGPPGHKCAGTLEGPTADIQRLLEDYQAPGKGGAFGIELAKLLDFHGHSWLGVIEWTYDESQLDEYGWGPVDFGEAKGLIRKYDHHNLNLFFVTPSAEVIAKAIYDDFKSMFGLEPLFVKLTEGAGNTMVYNGG